MPSARTPRLRQHGTGGGASLFVDKRWYTTAWATSVCEDTFRRHRGNETTKKKKENKKPACTNVEEGNKICERNVTRKTQNEEKSYGAREGTTGKQGTRAATASIVPTLKKKTYRCFSHLADEAAASSVDAYADRDAATRLSYTFSLALTSSVVWLVSSSSLASVASHFAFASRNSGWERNEGRSHASSPGGGRERRLDGGGHGEKSVKLSPEAFLLWRPLSCSTKKAPESENRNHAKMQ